MTCIVGIETQDGKVVMGGDTLGSNWMGKTEFTQSKVYKHSKMIFGYTSTYRFGQIVELLLDDNSIYVPEDPKDVYGWLVRTFIPKLQKEIKDCDVNCGNMLIGINGQLWEVQDDYSVLRAVTGFNSVGSGEAFAKGSVYSQVKINDGLPKDIEDATKMIKMSIEAAGNLSPSVSPNCTIVTL